MRFVWTLRRWLLGFNLSAFFLHSTAGAGLDHPAAGPAKTNGFIAVSDSEILQKNTSTKLTWSLQLGAAFITENNIGEILSGQIDKAKNEAGGQTYSFSLNWVAHRFQISVKEKVFRPQFEPYLTFTLVDEAGQSPFPDYNAGIGLRWVDFPWERWIRTSFFTGIGLSYSTRVYAVDRQRHPDVHRSHLKIDWPLQLTFSLPSLQEHQIVLFNDHQSGGHIFDEGGVNSLGIGYRWLF